MVELKRKECPVCHGTGFQDADPNAPAQCRKCDGTGWIRAKVDRKVRVAGEPRPLVVMLREDGVYIREHGRRTVYGPLNYGGLLLAGARQYADAKAQERKGRRLFKQSRARKARRGLTRGR